MIRAATLHDKVPAALLIYETMGAFGDASLGLGSKTFAIRAIEQFFIKTGNRFSWETSWMLEDDKIPKGILVAFPGKEYLRRNAAIALQLWDVYGLRSGIKLIWDSLQLMNTQETEVDEFYISHLAVGGEYRHMGYARQMLDWAEKLAKQHGLKKCSLTVEIDNFDAISLYKKMGYSIVETGLTPHLAEYFHTRGHYRMVQNIKAGVKA